MDRILTREEMEDWKANPTTQAILKYLLRCREDLKSQWATGVFQDEDPQVVAIANTSALEKYRVYTEVIELDYERYEGVMNDDSNEPEWLESRGPSSTV